VEGDPGAFAVISAQPQETIRQLRAAQGDLVLTRDAVRAVLEDLEAGRIIPEQAQQWASFVRRGYVAGNSSDPVGSVVPIDIEYDAGDEETIAEVLGRLDEIGDVVDGTLGSDEIGEMIRRLSSTRDLVDSAGRA